MMLLVGRNAQTLWSCTLEMLRVWMMGRHSLKLPKNKYVYSHLYLLSTMAAYNWQSEHLGTGEKSAINGPLMGFE